MRWPFRRKGARPGTDTADTTALAAPVARPNRQWTNLPPLPITVAPTAPLVMGPAPVLAPLPGPRLVFGPPVTPRTGRVEGLARAVPTSPEPPALVNRPPTSPSHSTAPEPPAPVPRPVVHSRPPEPPAPLTEAVPQYVGEPREPAEPYRAPAWLKYVPDWMKQQQGGEPDPFGLPVSTPEPVREEAPRPRPVFPPRLSESPQQTEPDVVEGEVAATPVDLPPRPKRRPNLGQTRRLGLGAPLKRAPEPEPDFNPATAPPRRPTPPPHPAAPPHSTVSPHSAPEPAAPVQESAARGAAADKAATAEEGGGDEPLLPGPPPQPPPRPAPRLSQPPPTGPARPVVASTSEPTKPVALVYRSAPGKREPASTTTRVPPGLAEAIRSRHGMDVADVPVHRTPAASTEARSLGARAFTKDAEVYLPAEAGSLDSPQARGLLAHELVHVVQQRTLGPALSTADGAALEAEAVVAEHEHSGPPTSPSLSTLVHPAITQVISQAARTAGVQLAPLVSEVSSSIAAPEVVPAASPEITSLSEPVRQDVGQISEQSAMRVMEQWSNPVLGGTGFGTGAALPQSVPVPDTPAAVESAPLPIPLPSVAEEAPAQSAAESEMASQVLQVVNMDRMSKGEPELTKLDESTMEQVRQAIAEQLSGNNNRTMMMATAAATSIGPADQHAGAGAPADVLSGQMTPEPAPVPVPTPAPGPEPARQEESLLFEGQLDLNMVDLDELSAKLYDRLRSRLRMELLIDRERAGLLTDFR